MNLKMNSFGRTFSQGKPLSKDLKSVLIDDILSEEDVSTEHFGRSFRAIGVKYKVTAGMVSKVWRNFCRNGKLSPSKCFGQPNKLEDPELDLVQLLKKNRPSITYSEPCYRPVLEYCTPAFHHALPAYLSDDIERVQKRVLSIVSPNKSYQDCLASVDLSTLKDRRNELCSQLFKSIATNPEHKAETNQEFWSS
ncbi:uncharacterized protein LOC114576507 [Exaiptasia diaphana]|uniref:Uncharacterized protein n=1 Tax=Exaiptasia diaphana TaxID=2652724 RepID=A0A913YX40_EXADI|nr:uncharacterized protein LOC114576507 [Exaiptasia diaphana]